MALKIGQLLCGAAFGAIISASLPAYADAPRARISAAPNAILDDDLKTLLERAVGRVPQAPRSDIEARRRARSAQELAIALLNSEGYYRPDVTVAPLEEGDTEAVLLVSPGPRFEIRRPTWEWTAGGTDQIVEETRPDTGNGTTAPVEPTENLPSSSEEPALPDEYEDDPRFPEEYPDEPAKIPDGYLEASGSIPYVRMAQPPINPVHRLPDGTTRTVDIGQIVDEAAELEEGAPARTVDIIAAEGRGIVALRNNGFAYALADPRLLEIEDVVVNAANPSSSAAPVMDYQMRPRFHFNAGPLVRLRSPPIYNADRMVDIPNKKVEVTNADGVVEEQPAQRLASKTRPDLVNRLVTWTDGDIYDPAKFAEMERRFMETGVYSSVSVSIPPQRGQNEDPNAREVTLPVFVRLEDRNRSQTEVNATFASDDGIMAGVYRTNYNYTGRADTLTYGLHWGDIDSRIGAEWTLPHFRNRINRTLRASAYLVNETTDAYERQAIALAADYHHRSDEKRWYAYGIGLDSGRYVELRYDPIDDHAIQMDRDLTLLTLRGSGAIDNTNNLLNPTEGWRANASVQPTAVTGTDTVFFLRSQIEGSAYYGVGESDRTILAGRVKIGSIVGAGELTVPSDRLFYSGGGGSVRGYSYQSINPRLPDNTPRGGVSLFETSLEVRQNIGQAWQAVAFVDGGATGPDQTPNLGNMRYGAGVGVRYKLPFGPIRADVAFPLNKREGDSDFQIYISIGQSF